MLVLSVLVTHKILLLSFLPTPSHVATILVRCSDAFFYTLNRMYSSVSNRKALPDFTENPPMSYLHDSVMQKSSGNLLMTRLIDIPEWAEDMKSSHSCKSLTTSGGKIIIFFERL